MGAGNVIAIVVPLNLISRTNGDAEALPGEAPLWVREQWVGLKHPLAQRSPAPRTWIQRIPLPLNGGKRTLPI